MTTEQRQPESPQDGDNSQKDSPRSKSGHLSWVAGLFLSKKTKERIKEDIEKQMKQKVEEIFSSDEIRKIQKKLEAEESKKIIDGLNKKYEDTKRELDKENEKSLQKYNQLNQKVNTAIYSIIALTVIFSTFSFTTGGGPIVDIMSIDVLRADIKDLKQDVRFLMENQE